MIETIPTASTLGERLRERILRKGPITFCDFMEAALYDEREGYYRRSDSKRWGREGDYRTSPERSGLFAATFARYFAGLYERLDQPSRWMIVEAGAGDGSFAHGVLETLRQFFPRVFKATRYIIDEPGIYAGSPARRRLEPFADCVEFGRLNEIKVNPGIIFSNELLDAFPVHRVIKQGSELREFYVSVAGDGALTWALGAPSSERIIRYFTEGDIHLAEGQVAEVNLAIEDWLTQVSAAIIRGYLVTVDYGSDAKDLYSSARDKGTLRGFRQHGFVEDLLAQPGLQDLTSSVNWTFVMDVAESLGLKTIEFERQDRFLLSQGLLTQLELESERGVDEADRLRLSTAAQEMILPTRMAASFQILVQEKVSDRRSCLAHV